MEFTKEKRPEHFLKGKNDFSFDHLKAGTVRKTNLSFRGSDSRSAKGKLRLGPISWAISLLWRVISEAIGKICEWMESLTNCRRRANLPKRPTIAIEEPTPTPSKS